MIEPKTFYSLDKLVSHGRDIASGFDTVTFDLFDTLLIRRIHDPDLVKPSVARYISSLAARADVLKSPQAVQKIRDRVEQSQRDETGKTFDDLEACYPVFMEQALREIFGSRYSEHLLDEVTRYELEMESRVLVPRQLFKEWLEDLQLQSKRVLIISDIYLPARHLEILVERAGLLHLVEAVVSSADTFLAKASGLAFPLVQETYNLDRSTWLHVGDNPISDGLRPGQFGIASLLLKDSEEKLRKALIKRYHNYAKGRPFYRGRALQQLMLPLEAENVERPQLYEEGYNFIGPMVGAFVQHIAERCRKLGLTKVYFFSREGYTFKKVWESCTPVLFPDGDVPAIEYLYVSRMALAGASCAHQGLTEANASIALLPPGNKDFKDIARIFQLDLEPLEPWFNKHKLAVDSVLSPLHEGYDQKFRVRFTELLENPGFQEQIKNQVRPAHEALIAYLDDLDFFDHSQVAVVDIGWLGTIQRFLYNAVKHDPRCPRLHGYVFGATRGVPFDDDLKSSLEGIIYDRDRFDIGASCILYARDIFEEACRAPHPTLEKYARTSSGYKLCFRTKDDDTGRAEMEQDAFYSPLQQGIFDSAERYGTASSLLGYSIEDYRPWFNYLLTAKLAFPKTSEVLATRHRHHLDDFHGAARPSPKKMKGSKLLWDCGTFSLRFLPFLRTRFFWRHIRTVLKS
jgi:FMN phosphatase YigB (HAD superfamily)